jgi:exosortase family protein XrtM
MTSASAKLGRMMTAPWRFGLKFVIGFAVLLGMFEVSRGTAFERFLIEDVILVPTAGLLNTLTPHDPVELRGRTLISAGSRLRVTRGCEGVELLLLLAAAVIAFPATAGRRLRGLLLGSVLAYVLSVTRLLALDYTLRYAPGGWEALHGLILPLAPVIVIALYFLRWSALSARAGGIDRQPHAA